jgi:hypothetical protein
LCVGHAGHFRACGRLHELSHTAGAARKRADLLRLEPLLEQIAFGDARFFLREELPRRVASRSAGANVKLDLHSCHEYRCSSNGNASL